VCVTCGSLNECYHDQEDPNNGGTAPPFYPDADSGYEMISNATISPHSEVFNTYGLALTNAQLLARYGFVLEDGNANDGVSWNMQQLRKFALTQYECDDALRTRGQATGRDGGAGWRVDGLMRLWQELIGAEIDDSHRLWADSDMVYNGTPRGGVDHEGNYASVERTMAADYDYGKRKVLRLNGDAKMTHSLWLFCVLLHLEGVDTVKKGYGTGARALAPSAFGAEGRDRDERRELSNIVALLREVADLHVTCEREARKEEGEVRLG
jgi:hypothetical protein